MRATKLTNRIVVQDRQTRASDAKRLVESCARTELAKLELSAPGFVALRQIRVRLVSRDGLPTRQALGRAWRKAIERAVRAELGDEEFGAGANVVRFRSDDEAQHRWLHSWTSRDKRPWWSKSVATSLDVDAPLEPAHVLLYWARERPEVMPTRVVELGARHPIWASMSSDDLELIWRTFAESVRGRQLETGMQFARELPVRLAEHLRIAEWAERVVELASNPTFVQVFLARMEVLCVVPGTPLEALESDLVALLRAAVEPEATRAERAPFDSLGTEQPKVRTDDAVASLESEPNTGTAEELTRVESYANEPVVEIWDSAGLGLLIHPLLAELRERCEAGADFELELEGLVQAAFVRTYGPTRERLIAALEYAGPFLAGWFGVAPNRGWLEPVRATDDAWISAVVERLPTDWGEPDERWSRLVFRAARIAVDLPYIELIFPLDAADIEIRTRGWDIDPGWVPALGRVLRFRYEETT